MAWRTTHIQKFRTCVCGWMDWDTAQVPHSSVQLQAPHDLFRLNPARAAHVRVRAAAATTELDWAKNEAGLSTFLPRCAQVLEALIPTKKYMVNHLFLSIYLPNTLHLRLSICLSVRLSSFFAYRVVFFAHVAVSRVWYSAAVSFARNSGWSDHLYICVRHRRNKTAKQIFTIYTRICSQVSYMIHTHKQKLYTLRVVAERWSCIISVTRLGMYPKKPPWSNKLVWRIAIVSVVVAQGKSHLHDVATNYPAQQQQHQQHVVSASYLELYPLDILSGRCLKSMLLKPKPAMELLLAYGASVKEGVECGQNGCLCVWNLLDPTAPQHVLVMEGEPCCACWAFVSSRSCATVVVCASNAGSMALWEVNENDVNDGPCAPHHPWGPHTPTFSTNYRVHDNHTWGSSLLYIISCEPFLRLLFFHKFGLHNFVMFLQCPNLQHRGKHKHHIHPSKVSFTSGTISKFSRLSRVAWFLPSLVARHVREGACVGGERGAPCVTWRQSRPSTRRIHMPCEDNRHSHLQSLHSQETRPSWGPHTPCVQYAHVSR